jgi:hypothetical protein
MPWYMLNLNLERSIVVERLHLLPASSPVATWTSVADILDGDSDSSVLPSCKVDQGEL